MARSSLYLQLLILLLTAGLSGCGRPTAASNPPVPETASPPPPYTYTPGPITPFLGLAAVKKHWAAAEGLQAPPRVKVKGIYLTAGSVANTARFQELLSLVDRTELNAVVINVKDDWGNIAFPADIPLARKAGAVTTEMKEIKSVMAELKRRSIYTIARIVSFKDNYIPALRPDLAVARVGGGIWRDFNGVSWLNPYNPEAWAYLVNVARAAALAGFDEVQFDYVRFPTDGNLDAIIYPGRDGRKREQVIAEFLAYARKELRPYRAWVSADVFGLVTSAADDMGIGQQLEEVSASVDYLSPMVYPSHYTPGNLGVSNPNAMPYETVYRSMLDAKERWEKAGESDKVVMRPWLQDFSWGYPYGPKEVRAQIQATYDAGFEQWLLWNAANVYSEAALEPDKAP